MNILFFALTWPDVADEHMYKDLMKEFVINGHQVYVVCPWEKRRAPAAPFQVEDGIRVARFTCGNIQKKKNKYVKVINLFLLNLQIVLALHRWFRNVKFDIIIFATPPITVSLTFKYLKNKFKAFNYLLLKDIWPQDAVDAGAMKKGGLVWNVFRYLEKTAYRNADIIGCGSNANVEYVLFHNTYLSNKKIEVCPNSLRLTPLSNNQDVVEVRKWHKIPEKKVVFVFGGNLGEAQGLNFLLDAAEVLRNYQEVYFLIIGSGTQYESIKARIIKSNLTNIELRLPIPKSDFISILQVSDVGLILLNNYFTVPNIPTKFIDYLQAGLPVLCAVDKATDVGRIVENAGCGFSCTNGDMDAFLALIDRCVNIKKEPVALKIMKDNARRLFIREYTTEKAYNTIMKHMIEQDA